MHTMIFGGVLSLTPTILAVLAAVAAGVSVKMSQGPVHVLAYEDALLECYLMGYSNFPLEANNLGVLWKTITDEKKISSYIAGQREVFRPGATIDGDILNGNMSLSLQNATFADELKYSCEIFIAPTDKVHGNVELQVSGRPSVNVSSPEILEVGKEASLVCEVDGYFPADIIIKWYQRREDRDSEISSDACHASPLKLHDGTYTASLQITIHATSHDVGNKFVCKVEHRSFVKLHEVAARLIIKEPEPDRSTQAILGGVLGVVFTTLAGAITFFVYNRYFLKVPPKVSDIAAAKQIIHKEICELKIEINGFKPDSVQIIWCLKRTETSEVIGKWIPETFPLIFGERMMLLKDYSKVEVDWSTKTSNISKNEDGTFSVSSSISFLPDIYKDDQALVICKVIHKANREPEEKSFQLTVNGVPPKMSHIIAPPLLLNDQVGTLTCPISSFKPPRVQISWFKLMKCGGKMIKELIGSFNGEVGKDEEVNSQEGKYTHRMSQLLFPDHKCSLYSMLAFKPTIKEDEEAEYTCEVMHIALLEPAKVLTKLHVTACPVVDPVVCIESQPTPVVGKPFKLECRVHSFYPAPIEISWLKDDQLLPKVSDDTDEKKGPNENCLNEVRSRWTIKPTLEDEGKDIVCEVRHETLAFPVRSAFNLHGIASSPEVSDIQCRPSQPVLGKPCVLSCLIRNFSPKEVQVDWYKNDGKIENKLGKDGDWMTYDEGENTAVKSKDEKAVELHSLKPELPLIPTTDDHDIEIRIEVLHSTLTDPIIKKYLLRFPGLPKFSTIELNPQTPEYGKPLSMSCRVDDLTTKQISTDWLVQDDIIKQGVTQSPLHPSKNGKYQMESLVKFVVTAEHFEKKFIFKVHDKENNQIFRRFMVLPLKPKVPKVSNITCDVMKPRKGQNITLSCSAVDFSPGEIRFMWSKGWNEVQSSAVKEYRRIGPTGLFSVVSNLSDTYTGDDVEIMYACEVHHIRTDIMTEMKCKVKFS